MKLLYALARCYETVAYWGIDIIRTVISMTRLSLTNAHRWSHRYNCDDQRDAASESGFGSGAMKAKFLHITTALLAVLCTAGVSFDSVMPQMHQAFASHRHIYCLEHHRIEDDGPTRDFAWVSDNSLGAEDQVTTTEGVPADLDTRPACLFSNLVVQTRSLIRAAWTCPTSTCAQKVETTRAVNEEARLSILLFAPKHSPPFSS